MQKEKLQAILMVILAGLGFSLMTFFVRISGDLPVMEKAFFRNLVAVVVAAVTLIRQKEALRLPDDSKKWLFLRCFFGTCGLILNFYTIDHMNIADSNMLNKLSPFFAIIASIFILKEKVNKVEWVTVAIAFAGALCIIKPSFQMSFFFGLCGMTSGLAAGLAYTCVRKTASYGVSGAWIVFCFSAFSCTCCLPLMMISYKPMAGWQLLCLILAGLSATVGQFAITKAYSKAPAREISVFDYSQIVWTAILGMLFLDQFPDGFSILGYLIIIGVAVFRWQYNLKNA